MRASNVTALLVTFVTLELLLGCAGGAPSAEGPSVRGAANPPEPGLPIGARPETAAATTPTLAREVEQRGLRVMGPDAIAAAFSHKGNVAVSPFAAGLTSIVTDAVFASDPNASRRYAPVVSTAAACFGAAFIEHTLVVPESVQPSSEVTEITALLSPGRHLGSDDDPPGASHCAPAYSPIRSAARPSIRDLRPVSPDQSAWPAVEGDRLAQSTVRVLPRFARCADTQARFVSCGERPPSTADLLFLAGSDEDSTPSGIEIDARVHVERSDGATIVAVPIDQLGVLDRWRTRQTLVLVLPADSCDGSIDRMAGGLMERARAVVALPRDVDARIALPDISTRHDVAAKVAAPASSMLLSTKMFTPLCPHAATALDGRTRIVFDRPFLYAVVDDATGAVLVIGRYAERDRAEGRDSSRGNGASTGGSGAVMVPPVR